MEFSLPSLSPLWRGLFPPKLKRPPTRKTGGGRKGEFGLLLDYGDGLPMPSYMMCPKALRKLKLNGTEIMIYLSVLDRCRLSARNRGWRDAAGRVWCYYTVRALAKDLDRGETAVKAALRSLENRGLIRRERQGLGRPDRIFVRLLPDREEPPDPWENKDWKVLYLTLPGTGPLNGLPDPYAPAPEKPEAGLPMEEKADPPEVREAVSSEVRGSVFQVVRETDLHEGRKPDLPEVRDPGPQAGGDPPPNKNYIKRTMEEQEGSNTARRPRADAFRSFLREERFFSGDAGEVFKAPEVREEDDGRPPGRF